MRSIEDRLFERFQRTGNTRALGALFDRVAPDLLKVARYLSGDRAFAEDLVQATFMAALESKLRTPQPGRVELHIGDHTGNQPAPKGW